MHIVTSFCCQNLLVFIDSIHVFAFFIFMTKMSCISWNPALETYTQMSRYRLQALFNIFLYRLYTLHTFTTFLPEVWSHLWNRGHPRILLHCAWNPTQVHEGLLYIKSFVWGLNGQVGFSPFAGMNALFFYPDHRHTIPHLYRIWSPSKLCVNEILTLSLWIRFT